MVVRKQEATSVASICAFKGCAQIEISIICYAIYK